MRGPSQLSVPFYSQLTLRIYADTNELGAGAQIDFHWFRFAAYHAKDDNGSLHDTPLNLCSSRNFTFCSWRASVSNHQVQCNIPTFEALLRKYTYLFLERCRKSNNVWLRALMQSDCLYSSLFFEHCNRILLCE